MKAAPHSAWASSPGKEQSVQQVATLFAHLWEPHPTGIASAGDILPPGPWPWLWKGVGFHKHLFCRCLRVCLNAANAYWVLPACRCVAVYLHHL